MSETMANKTHGAVIPIRLSLTDSTASVGRLTTEVARKISTMITTQFTQDPDDYNVDITITMEAKNLD